MNVLGLQFGHDAGIAILANGIPVTNMIRERHNRAKHAFGINVSHIEGALARTGMSENNIDMVAITSTQNYELVNVDRPDQLQIRYSPHPDSKINSSLYDVLLKEGRGIEEKLTGSVLSRVYSGTSQYHRNHFPEYSNVRQDSLGTLGFLTHYVSLPLWEKELGLSDIANVDINPLISDDQIRLGLHYPITVTLKGRQIPGVVVQHHAAHAASIFYTATNGQAAVMTHDGGFYEVGPNNGMIFYGDRNRLWPIVPNHLSIGDLYDRVGTYLGFDLFGAAGKLMGLAPYGRPRFFHRKMVGNTYDLKKNGVTSPERNWLAHCKVMAEVFGYDLSPLGDVDRILEPVCVDIAASTQKLFEETILSAVEATSDLFVRSNMPMNTLCLSGGTALNCPTNTRVLAESAFETVHIPPHCDDSGLSLGAAQYLYHNVLDQPRRKELSEVLKDFPYLGLQYEKEEVELALQGLSEAIEARFLTNASQHAAEDLHDNMIVAWFEGRSEIGPRALGHRSLLANPRHLENWERMNRLNQGKAGVHLLLQSLKTMRKLISEDTRTNHHICFIQRRFRQVNSLRLPTSMDHPEYRQ